MIFPNIHKIIRLLYWCLIFWWQTHFMSVFVINLSKPSALQVFSKGCLVVAHQKMKYYMIKVPMSFWERDDYSKGIYHNNSFLNLLSRRLKKVLYSNTYHLCYICICYDSCMIQLQMQTSKSTTGIILSLLCVQIGVY